MTPVVNQVVVELLLRWLTSTKTSAPNISTRCTNGLQHEKCS